MARAAASSALRGLSSFGRTLIAREPEFNEPHAILRRAKLRAFLRALDDPQLPHFASAALRRLSPRLPSPPPPPTPHATLAAAARELAAALPPAPPLVRDAHADWPLQDDPFASAAAPPPPPPAPAGGGGEAAAPAPTPLVAPNPLDLPEPKDVVLDEEERGALASRRAAHALRELAALWEGREEAQAAPAVDEALEALGSGSPSLRMKLYLQVARGPEASLSDASGKELRAAALRSVEGVQPFAFDLWSESTLLQPAEQAHLERLRATPALLPSLLTRRTLWMRAQDLFTPRADPPHDEADILQLARAKDPSCHRLYAALASEATLHLALADALLTHHDRRHHRRARTKLVAQGLAAFVLFNILDFTVSNM
ncbi:hypothetical protein AB1Y20_005610 [Prymnesium parvum]|uniref:Ubiquinone biosynthesis protein n=1 Tax=Prymnesium parvum TaxID=97485 RepID=A0AB34J6P0_PRYPA